MAKRKSGHRVHDGDQVPTRPVTVLEIMSSPTFTLGVADVRAGLGYRSDYQRWDGNTQWNYERGLQWARQAPRTVALKRNDKITDEAIRWYTDDII